MCDGALEILRKNTLWALENGNATPEMRVRKVNEQMYMTELTSAPWLPICAVLNIIPELWLFRDIR